MIYAEFYHLSTGYIEGTIPPQFSDNARKPIPACGSDSVLKIDGRLNMRNRVLIATDVCRKRGFLGFTLNAGASFSRSREIRKYQSVVPVVLSFKGEDYEMKDVTA